MQLHMSDYSGYGSGDECKILPIQVHKANRMCVGLQQIDRDVTAVLGPPVGGLGGRDDLAGLPASGCNAYPSGVHVVFADGWEGRLCPRGG